jgi:hypothetical protein
MVKYVAVSGSLETKAGLESGCWTTFKARIPSTKTPTTWFSFPLLSEFTKVSKNGGGIGVRVGSGVGVFAGGEISVSVGKISTVSLGRVTAVSVKKPSIVGFSTPAPSIGLFSAIGISLPEMFTVPLHELNRKTVRKIYIGKPQNRCRVLIPLIFVLNQKWIQNHYKILMICLVIKNTQIVHLFVFRYGLLSIALKKNDNWQ